MVHPLSSPCPSPMGSCRRHLPRCLLCVLVSLMACHPLPARIEENSSDWGQSPGRCGAAPAPPLLLDFLPRIKVGRRTGRWGLRHWVPRHSDVVRWATVGGRAALAVTFLGPAGGAGMAGRGAGPFLFPLLSLGTSLPPPKAWIPGTSPTRGRPLQVLDQGGGCSGPLPVPSALPHDLCDFSLFISVSSFVKWKTGCRPNMRRGRHCWVLLLPAGPCALLSSVGPGPQPCSLTGLARRSRLLNPQHQVQHQPCEMFAE